MEVAEEMKFDTKIAWGEDDAQTLSTRIAQRKHAIPHAIMKNNRNVACVLVTVLCNEPEACASELGDNQSHYFSWLL